MNKRLTSMLGIKYPILLSGMSFISTPELVAAVSHASRLFILATGPLRHRPNAKRNQKDPRTYGQTSRAGVTPSLSRKPGRMPRYCSRRRSPSSISPLGKEIGSSAMRMPTGEKSSPTVTNPRHARRAQDFGVDAVIATGYEAAAGWRSSDPSAPDSCPCRPLEHSDNRCRGVRRRQGTRGGSGPGCRGHSHGLPLCGNCGKSRASGSQAGDRR